VLIANRLGSLDADAIGIEMEGGRPGVRRSLNGLPALFGSGLSETIELSRAIRIASEALKQIRTGRTQSVSIFEELVELMQGLEPELKKLVGSRSQRAAISYWEASHALKDAYRARVRLGISGNETRVPLKDVSVFLQAAGDVVNRIFVGKNRNAVVSKSGVPLSYFVNDVTDYEPTGQTHPLGYPCVQPLYFQQKPVKLFLDAPLHWIAERSDEAKTIYESVVRSGLYDKKLKMVKTTESLRGESSELGHTVGAHARGFLDNEAIDVAMQTQFLRALLEAGLTEEFWKDAKRALVPFMDPMQYGRSTLEAASFIVSSAYADEAQHGRGYQPRSAAATAEHLKIWLILVAGVSPMRLDKQGRLELAFEPRLPGSLFTTEPTRRAYFDPRDGWTELVIPASAFAFKLFGHTLVVYENTKRKDTWGRAGAQARAHLVTYRNGKNARINTKTIPARVARAVRGGEVSRIDVTLG
jgi:hypothetical protein